MNKWVVYDYQVGSTYLTLRCFISEYLEIKGGVNGGDSNK